MMRETTACYSDSSQMCLLSGEVFNSDKEKTDGCRGNDSLISRVLLALVFIIYFEEKKTALI